MHINYNEYHTTITLSATCIPAPMYTYARVYVLLPCIPMYVWTYARLYYSHIFVVVYDRQWHVRLALSCEP